MHAVTDPYGQAPYAPAPAPAGAPPADPERVRANRRTAAALVGAAHVCVLDAQHVPERGGALLVPNHVSFLDALFVIANSSVGRYEPDGSTMTAFMWLVWIADRQPVAPFWIPPGCRAALRRAGDDERFTAHPVTHLDPKTARRGVPRILLPRSGRPA